MIFKYFLFSGVIFFKFGLAQAEVSSDSFSDKVKTNLLVKAENKKAKQTAVLQTRKPSSLALEKIMAQVSSSQAEEIEVEKPLSATRKSEPKAQGVILKFSEWPSPEEQSIKDRLKKAGLEESLKIERFKVWVYKWKSVRSAIENEDLCSDFSALSSVQSCELDLLLEPAKSQSSSDSPGTFNLKTCNILSSEFSLSKVPNLKDRGGALTDYWAQEMVGADLLKKQIIESADSAKKPTVELFDSNKQNKHDELVKNIISGDGRSSVLPSLADNMGVSQSDTVSDLLRHSDAFLNKMDKVCADSKANQKVSSGQAGGTSGGSSGQGQTAGGTGQVGAGTGGTSGGSSGQGQTAGGISQVGAGTGGTSDDSSEQRQTASSKSGGSSDLAPSSQKQKERTKKGSEGQLQTNTGIDWETPLWKIRVRGGDSEMMRVYTARWEALLGVNNPFPSNPYWVAAWERKSVGGGASVMPLTYNGVSGYNAVDPQTGNTVLHVFSAIGSHHNVAMLRQFGVDEKARNRKGQQAWELWGVISTTLGEPDNTDYKEEMRKAAGGESLKGQGSSGSISGNLLVQGQSDGGIVKKPSQILAEKEDGLTDLLAKCKTETAKKDLRELYEIWVDFYKKSGFRTSEDQEPVSGAEGFLRYVKEKADKETKLELGFPLHDWEKERLEKEKEKKAKETSQSQVVSGSDGLSEQSQTARSPSSSKKQVVVNKKIEPPNAELTFKRSGNNTKVYVSDLKNAGGRSTLGGSWSQGGFWVSGGKQIKGEFMYKDRWVPFLNYPFYLPAVVIEGQPITKMRFRWFDHDTQQYSEWVERRVSKNILMGQ